MSKLPKKKVIGITGSMGSGKSEVKRYISKSYPVLDCDWVNAKLLEKGQAGYHQLKKLGILKFDQEMNIDKVELAKYMFSNLEHKKLVENILHPLIFEYMENWIKEQSQELVFIEIPLLFEIQAQDSFDSIWCVVTSRDIALQRLQKYRHFTYEQAIARLNHQMDPEWKMKQSHVVLKNNGTKEELYQQIKGALKKEEV